MGTRQPLCRLYFNRSADEPKVWSVDLGPGTPEICAAVVVIEADGETRYRRSDGDGAGAHGEDVKMPRAWIEFRHVEIEIADEGLVIRA